VIRGFTATKIRISADAEIEQHAGCWMPLKCRTPQFSIPR